MYNFISTFEELNKLYEEAPKVVSKVKKHEEAKEPVEEACIKEELLETTPTVKLYTKQEAEKIIQADEKLLAEYNELLPDYEEGMLDNSFKYGNFFNLIEDESKVVIQWLKSETESAEIIVDSLETALVAIRDIEAAQGNVYGSSLWIDEELTEAANDEEIEIVDDEAPVEELAEEEPVADEPRQVIMECSKCGALVIKDEADVVADEESDLVNIEDECQYCEEAEGYKIIGSVMPYGNEESVEEPVVDEEPVEEAIEDEVVEEGLLDIKTPATIAADILN